MNVIDVQTSVTGDDRVAQMFKTAGLTVRAQVRSRLAALLVRLQTLARSRTPHKSGDLQESEKVVLKEDDSGILGRVGPTRFYGRFLEFGLRDHMVAVRRRVRGRDVRGVLGVKTKMTKLGTVQVISRRGVIFRGESVYQRRIHLTARPFLQPAYEAMEQEIRDELEQALADGVRDAEAS